MRFKKNVRMTLLYLAFIVIGVAMVFPFILKPGRISIRSACFRKSSHWKIIVKFFPGQIFPDGF